MIEQELIAACLRDNALRHEVGVEPHHFTSAVHAEIFEHIQQAPESFDAVTIMTMLSDAGKHDAADRVIDIANTALGISASAKQHASSVIKAYQKRRVQEILQVGLESLDSGEVIRQLMELEQPSDRFECSIAHAMREALDDIERASEGIRGITTGFRDLDDHLGGWHRGDLTVIGARPAMGKTALLLHFAQSAKVPMGLVSAEQPAYQVAQRHVSSMGKVALSKLRQGKIGQAEMQAILATNKTLKDYWIYHPSAPSIADVGRVARRWKHQHGIEVLFVDYIQRIQGTGNNRVEQVGSVVRGLKTIARELDIPVVALAQVSRQVENRDNKRPGMADLSDSSEIEKEADQVVTMYRDEVYDPNSAAKGECELKIAKNRHGYTGTVCVSWHGETVSFGNATPW